MKKNIAFISILGSLLSGVAFADSGPFVGAGYIYSSYKDTESRIKGNDSGYNIYAGYDFNKFIAIDAGYSNFFNTSKENQKFKADAWLASTKVTLPILFLDVYGRAGYGSFSTNFGSKSDFYYGAGIGLNIGPVRAGLEYTMYDVKVLRDTVGLNVEIHF